jgi:signal transduction histidine kinase/CheY-like chemotaxis protein
VNSRLESVDRRGWRWSEWPARLRSVLWGLGALALPVLPLVVLVLMARVPAEVGKTSTPLVGAWKVIASDQDGLDDEGIDDSGWESIDLPANFAFRGPPGRDHWLRRRVELAHDGRSQFLLLGNVRNGLAELYVNGGLVGRSESVRDAYQMDYLAQQGWEIPPSMLRDGNNLLALRVSWSTYNQNGGLVDQRMSIGSTHRLRPYFVRAKLVNSILSLGSFAICAALFILLFVLRLATPRQHRGARLDSVLVLLGAQLVFVGVIGGVLGGVLGDRLALSEVAFYWLTIAAIAVLAVSLWGFVEIQYLGRTTRLLKANIVITSVVVLAVCLYPRATGIAFVYLGLSFAWACLISVRGILRASGFRGLVQGWALVVVYFAGLVDVSSGLGLHNLPVVFQQSLMNLCVVASVLLGVEFIDIARKNQLLSFSLATTNADLATAVVRAREGTRVKSELLATVSHEMRTPLNSIINIPEGLLEDFVENDQGWAYTGAPERTVSYLRRIGSSGRHLLSIVNDVLEFSRLNAGKLPLQLQSVSVVALLSELRDIVEPLAREKRVSLVFPAHLPEAPLRADGLRVKQVLLNLVGNAIKFSSTGGTIEIGVATESGFCVFSVRDEGIGIAPEHQKLIFESFRQVDGGTTRPFGGTGLGLAIAHDLVSLHGGRIWVASELGKGSTFAFRLPVEGPPQGAMSAIQTRPNESRTIVIVEDDATTLETIKLALRSLDCLLVGTTEPRSALGLVKELKPALVVLDLMMPHLSGLDVLGQLRGEIENGSLRVLVTSAYHEHEARARSLGAGWVPKPWDGTQLVEGAAALIAQSLPAERAAHH